MRVPRALVILGCAVVLVVGGAVAYAAIPSADGTFTACINKTSGAVRIIDTATAQRCASNEIRRSWNQQGQPGADGVSGYEIVRKQGRIVATSPTEFITDSVACPLGKVATGGGGNGAGIVTDGNGNQIITGLADVRSSFPIEGDANDPAEWAVRFGTADGGAFAQGQGVDYTLFVTCATAS